MRFAGTDRDDYGPWFRIGQLEVTTTVFAVLLWVVSVILFAAQPTSQPVTDALMLRSEPVLSGEVWRLVTWPMAQEVFSLWDIISVAILWMLGTELERQLGRREMAVLLLSSIVTIGVCATLLGALIGDPNGLLGVRLVTLTVLLLYIAEHPTRPFLFNIPAWVIAAVIVALEVINDVARRDWVQLLTIVLAAGIIMLIARRLQLLTAYDWIPELGGGTSRRKQRTKRSKGPSRRAKRRAQRSGLQEVPSAPPADLPGRPPRRTPPPRTIDVPSADDIALDLLLDKISAGGIDSLTADERRQLDEIQARRKRGR